MIFKQINSGGDRNYAYLIGCENTKLAAVADPSPDPTLLMKEIEKYELDVIYIFNTHSHPDHTGGNDYLKKSTGAKIVTFKGGGGDLEVSDGAVLNAGKVSFEFIHTPGHTQDSVCIKTGDNLITGDTLFVGKVGGTYTEEEAKVEFHSLKKLISFPENLKVWPGHNYGTAPSSTILNEKQTNPFIQRLNDFNEFLWLKQNWAAYKVEHGIK
ncbi:MAG: MBL fold metallo-hydrolase [Candidatus Aminicenantes bacterium]|nr:MBL fold metallo-hydrolase [Candidatus Aminicenantes bacterium]